MNKASFKGALTATLLALGASQSPCTGEAQAEHPLHAAKKAMIKVYRGHFETIYCGCEIKDFEKKVDPKLCGMEAKKLDSQSFNLTWEHVVPVGAISKDRPCYNTTKKERKQKSKNAFCRENDPIFSDMHNLFPESGELNNDRRDTPFGMVEGEKRQYGKCDFEIGDSAVEPRPQVRGDIARTYFYMEQKYRLQILTDEQRMLFKKWSAEDPVDEWEKERNRRIKAIQGNGNPFIEKK